MISKPDPEQEKANAPAPQAPACIRCGRCLEVCPLFQATQREELSPKAKQLLAEAMSALQKAGPVLAATRAKEGMEVNAKQGAREGTVVGALPAAALGKLAAANLASLCLGCGRCAEVCPQGLNVPDVVAALRAAHPGFRAWIWKTWMIKAPVLWPALSALAIRLPEHKAGLRLRTLQALRLGPGPAPWLQPVFDKKPRVNAPTVLFGGCLANYVRQDWLAKARAMTQGLGIALAPSPAWSCCGASLGNAGLPGLQRTLRARNLRAWREAGRPRLLLFCASCLDGLRAYAQDATLDWAPGEPAAWLASLTPLAALWGDTPFRLAEHAPHRLHYHQPCHGNAGALELEWLRQAVGERLKNWTAAECCGLGGVLQLSAPELGRQVAQACWTRLAAQAGDHVLTGCSGCVVQLSATAPPGVYAGHWLDALALETERMEGPAGQAEDVQERGSEHADQPSSQNG